MQPAEVEIFVSVPARTATGTSDREWRDACWKVSQGQMRILSETAVSRRKSLRTIPTSLLCRTALATASLSIALVTAAVHPVLAGGGNGGAGSAGLIGGGTGGADGQPGAPGGNAPPWVFWQGRRRRGRRHRR